MRADDRVPLGTVGAPGVGKDGSMPAPALFNFDALFALVTGLVLLFNPLLGPVLPLPGALIVLVAIAALVAACVLGRAGMGRGGLVARIRAVAIGNLGGAVVLGVWATISCRAGGRILILLIAAGLGLLGLAQLLTKVSNPPPMAKSRRGTVEELQQALRSK